MRPDTATPNWSRWTLKSQEPLRMWQMSSRPRAGTTQSSISFTKSCRQTYPQGEHQSQSWQNTREVLGALEDLGVGQGSAEDREALINRCVGVAHIRHLNGDTPEPQMQDIAATHSTSKQTQTILAAARRLVAFFPSLQVLSTSEVDAASQLHGANTY